MEFKLSKNKVKEDYFDIINTENKAYLLGFFLADGCITIEYNNRKERAPNYRFCFNNSIDDLETINKFKDEVCPNSNIVIKNKQNKDQVKRKDQCQLRWSSKYMHNSLKELYNIKIRKTQDIEFIFPFDKIPKDLIRHFIRGFFDGDGNITFHKYKNTIQFNFAFCATSLKFSNQVSEIIEKLDKDINRKIKPVKGKNMICYQIRFNYQKHRTKCIQKIYDWFYKDSSIYLLRKKIKFENYFQYRANCTSKQWKVV